MVAEARAVPAAMEQMCLIRTRRGGEDLAAARRDQETLEPQAIPAQAPRQYVGPSPAAQAGQAAQVATKAHTLQAAARMRVAAVAKRVITATGDTYRLLVAAAARAAARVEATAVLGIIAFKHGAAAAVFPTPTMAKLAARVAAVAAVAVLHMLVTQAFTLFLAREDLAALEAVWAILAAPGHPAILARRVTLTVCRLPAAVRTLLRCLQVPGLLSHGTPTDG